jgi:GTPase SAR1 family protein
MTVVGDTCAGKTNLLTSFNSDDFGESTESTVGAQLVARQIATSHGCVNRLCQRPVVRVGRAVAQSAQG